MTKLHNKITKTLTKITLKKKKHIQNINKTNWFKNSISIILN